MSSRAETTKGAEDMPTNIEQSLCLWLLRRSERGDDPPDEMWELRALEQAVKGSTIVCIFYYPGALAGSTDS